MAARPEFSGREGYKCIVAGKEGDVAWMRYYGEHKTKEGWRCGIELSVPEGKNNGTIEGYKYFDCAANYGMLVDPAKVTLLPDDEQLPDLVAMAGPQAQKSKKELAKEAKEEKKRAAIKKKEEDKRKKEEKKLAKLGKKGAYLAGKEAPVAGAGVYAAEEDEEEKGDKPTPGKLKAPSFASGTAGERTVLTVGKLVPPSFESNSSSPEKREIAVGKLNTPSFESNSSSPKKKEIDVGRVANPFAAKAAGVEVTADPGPQVKPGNDGMRAVNEKFSKLLQGEAEAKQLDVLQRRSDWVSDAANVVKEGYVEEIKPVVMSPKAFTPDASGGETERKEIAVDNKEKQAREREQKKKEKEEKKLQDDQRKADIMARAEADAQAAIEAEMKRNPLCTHDALEARIGHSGAKLDKTGYNTLSRSNIDSKKVHPMLKGASPNKLKALWARDE